MLRAIGALLFVVLLSAQAPTPGSRPSQEVSQAQQHGAAPAGSNEERTTDKRGSKAAPIAIQLMNTGKSQAEADQEAAHVKFEEKTQSWLIGLTIAAVFFAALQFGGLVFQAIFMRDTVSEMRRANDAAEDANAATREVLTITDRPWFGIDVVRIKPLEAGKPIVSLVVLRNSGRTPAFRVRGGTVFRWTKKGDPAPKIPDLLDRYSHCATVMPGVALYFHPFEGTPPLSKVDIEQVNAGDIGIWIVGHIEYFDAIGSRHETHLHLQYHPTTNSFGPSIDGNEVT